MESFPVQVRTETRHKLAAYAEILAGQRGHAVSFGEVIEWLIEVEEGHYGQLH